MNKNQNSKMIEILAAFSELYGKEISEGTARVYYGALKEYTAEQLDYAAEKIMKTHALSRFPLPADFIKHIEPSQEEEKLNARTAWNTALRKMELEGRWYTVKFDDPNIHFTISSLGGWIEFGDRLEVTTPENLIFVEKDFIEAYLACKHTIPQGTVIPELVGRIELSNSQKGYLKDGILTLPSGNTKQVPFNQGGLDEEIKTITESQGGAVLPELSKTDE